VLRTAAGLIASVDGGLGGARWIAGVPAEKIGLPQWSGGCVARRKGEQRPWEMKVRTTKSGIQACAGVIRAGSGLPRALRREEGG